MFRKAMAQDQSLRFYEEVLTLRPETSEQERREICAAAAEVIEAHGGKVRHLDTWGSRSLANPDAKGASRGWYFYTLFSANSQAVQELRRQLRINSKVIYFHHEKLLKHETPERRLKSFSRILERSEAQEKDRLARIQKRPAGFGRRPEPSKFQSADLPPKKTGA